MIFKKIYQILGPSLLATLITGAAYYADSYSRLKYDQRFSEQWANQIIHQAETLILDAKEKGESDPVHWAIGRLSQGPEKNRMIQISRITLNPGFSKSTFTPRWSAKNHEWEYTKPIEGDSHQALSIQIKTRPAFFLGTPNLFWSDVLTFLLFAMIFLISWKHLPQKAQPSIPVTHTAPPSVEPTPLEVHLAWIAESKTLLSRLGTAIRQILVESRTISETTLQSYSWVGQTRSQAHHHLHDLKKGHDQIKNLQKNFEDLEALILNLMIEGSRIAEPDSLLLRMISEIHQAIQKIRRTHSILELSLRKIEIGIEPWTKNLDLAQQQMSHGQEATRRLLSQIDETKDSLMGQAKHIQSFQDRLQSAADKNVQAQSAAKRAV